MLVCVRLICLAHDAHLSWRLRLLLLRWCFLFCFCFFFLILLFPNTLVSKESIVIGFRFVWDISEFVAKIKVCASRHCGYCNYNLMDRVQLLIVFFLISKLFFDFFFKVFFYFKKWFRYNFSNTKWIWKQIWKSCSS